MTPRQAGVRQPRPDSPYRGRFAPSPPGPLHFGSLATATASYLQARCANGEWLLRVEDIDPPREIAGATQQILATLRAHGFQWSGQSRYQSLNLDRFEAVVETLLARDQAFRCTCSRRQVRDSGRIGRIGPVYPGTCRAKRPRDSGKPQTIRLRTTPQTVSFDDQLHGNIQSAVADEIGDFVIRRMDGLIAYALAVVIDDHDQGVTEVVRGDDLLDFTPAQIYLQQVLGLETPAYMHVPVALNAAGEKLSKQTGASPVDDSKPADNLFRCLEFLGQKPPASLCTGSVADIWTWAQTNWQPAQLAGRTGNPA